jgi:hypothetical protein
MIIITIHPKTMMMMMMVITTTSIMIHPTMMMPAMISIMIQNVVTTRKIRPETPAKLYTKILAHWSQMEYMRTRITILQIMKIVQMTFV